MCNDVRPHMLKELMEWFIIGVVFTQREYLLTVLYECVERAGGFEVPVAQGGIKESQNGRLRRCLRFVHDAVPILLMNEMLLIKDSCGICLADL
jgi:hypothetical protein